jgi:hypothetical protein
MATKSKTVKRTQKVTGIVGLPETVGGLHAVSARGDDGTVIRLFKSADEAGWYHGMLYNSKAKAIGRMVIPVKMTAAEFAKVVTGQFAKHGPIQVVA